MTTEWKISCAEILKSCVMMRWTRSDSEGLMQDLFVFLNCDNTVDLYAKETWEGHTREHKLTENRQYIMGQKDISAAFFRAILMGEKQP